MRFIKDCEKVLGKEIEILKSPYGSVENAIRAAGLIGNARTTYYPCTNWLKKRVRKEWEYEHRDYDITYVWGTVWVLVVNVYVDKLINRVSFKITRYKA